MSRPGKTRTSAGNLIRGAPNPHLHDIEVPPPRDWNALSRLGILKPTSAVVEVAAEALIRALAERQERPVYVGNLEVHHHGLRRALSINFAMFLAQIRDRLATSNFVLDLCPASSGLPELDVAAQHPERVYDMMALAETTRKKLGEYGMHGSEQRPTGSLFPEVPVIGNHMLYWDQLSDEEKGRAKTEFDGGPKKKKAK